jgi:hypothetical protein
MGGQEEAIEAMLRYGVAELFSRVADCKNILDAGYHGLRILLGAGKPGADGSSVALVYVGPNGHNGAGNSVAQISS